MESLSDVPTPNIQYEVLMRGDVIAVPLTNDRPDFDARQFWVDVATSLDSGHTTDLQKKQYGEMFDAYFNGTKGGEEIRPGSGLYAMLVWKRNKDGEDIQEIAVQNRNGRGNQSYNDKLKEAVETALAPKPTDQAE